jgi:hypothetical protein
MKLIEKIQEFDDIEGLISEIKSDKVTNDILSRRFPVRLIFLQRFETFRLLIEKLIVLNIDIYHIEKDLPKSDGWITKDSLINILNNIKKDTAVVPFSEIVRFYSDPDFKNFFNQLLLIENTSDLSKRIYLPLIGIEERFEKDFFVDFTRKQECAPFWKITKEKPNTIKVFLSTNNNIINIPNYEVIANSEQWLRFWKQKSPSDVICYAKPLNLFYKNTLPDTIFTTIEQFNNPKFLIERIFNKEIPIPFVDIELSYWNKLISSIKLDSESFISFVKRYFKVTSLTINTLLEFWLKTDEHFDKWLLKHFVLSQECLKRKYIYNVLESLTDYTDHTLLKSLYQTIFILEIREDFINDRFTLIKQFSNLKTVTLCDEVINDLNNNLRAFTDYNQALLLTTGLLQFEKIFIFKLFAEKKIIDFEILTQKFPDISNYLSAFSFDNIKEGQEWVYEYLIEYKNSKLSDNISDKLNEILSTINADENSFYKWYHSFESIHSILHINKVDKVFWIDALGIEWVSFIQNYLQQTRKDIQIVKQQIGVSNLPTSTEQNRFECSKYIRDFDIFIHSDPYSYPVSVINEFNEIKRIIDTYLTLDSKQTVAIVSDHGLTALSRLVDSKKYGKDDSHEGRYIEVMDKDHSRDSDYIIYKSEVDHKNYLIALKHNSLGRKPLREAHGGCTPEEVLVSLIIISNKKDLPKVEYSIVVEKTEIYKKKPVICIDIIPKPISAIIEVAGKTIKLNFNNSNNRWEANFDKTLTGKQIIKVIVAQTEKLFTINLISGLIEEELF